MKGFSQQAKEHQDDVAFEEHHRGDDPFDVVLNCKCCADRCVRGGSRFGKSVGGRLLGVDNEKKEETHAGTNTTT